MSADDIRLDLKAYLDGELTPERAAEVERAISESSELRTEVEDMKRITQSLKAMAHGPAITGESKAVDAVSGRRATGLQKILAVLVPVATVAIVAAILSPVYMQSKEAARLGAPTSMPMDSAANAAEEAKGEELMPHRSSMSPRKEPAVVDEDSTINSGGGGMAGKQRQAEGYERNGRELSSLPGNAVKPEFQQGIRLDEQRSVVRTATLSVKVTNAEKAERSVTSLVTGYRGFVESSESSNLESKTAMIVMSVRVPEKLFNDALLAFEKLGTRTAKVISGQDVSAQLVDMGARLKNLRAQEETYRNILRQTRRVGEVLEVQQRISEIRSEIESMDAQMQSLGKLAALSSISVTLEQRPSGPQAEVNEGGWASDAWASAVGAMSGAMKSIFSAGIWILVYAPIWLPIAFIGWALGRRLARA